MSSRLRVRRDGGNPNPIAPSSSGASYRPILAPYSVSTTENPASIQQNPPNLNHSNSTSNNNLHNSHHLDMNPQEYVQQNNYHYSNQWKPNNNNPNNSNNNAYSIPFMKIPLSITHLIIVSVGFTLFFIVLFSSSSSHPSSSANTNSSQNENTFIPQQQHRSNVDSTNSIHSQSPYEAHSSSKKQFGSTHYQHTQHGSAENHDFLSAIHDENEHNSNSEPNQLSHHGDHQRTGIVESNQDISIDQDEDHHQQENSEHDQEPLHGDGLEMEKKKMRIAEDGFASDFVFTREPIFQAPSSKLRDKLAGRALIPSVIPDAEDILKQRYASRIIVSEKSKMLYCPVPKAGNSNWKVLIRKHEGFANYRQLDIANNKNLNGLKYLHQMDPHQIDAILNDPSWFRFAIVRNPYERHLSAYLNKFVQKHVSSAEYKLFYKQLTSYNISDEQIEQSNKPTFLEFTQRIASRRPEYMNEHWAPQHYICGFGMIPYDFIGRLETIADDSNVVFEALGWENEVFPSQKQIGFVSSGANKKLDEFYDDQVFQEVSSKFSRDFDILQYTRHT
uniref:Carbohydrate sulfotransferase n=1 Tax=Timspurckia oligopyrenoides TaxID=708627 RepID=A0A7S0ZJ04_9RHOD|mmetsp:Transcript_714/g.1286  ORF Transcript_714/g.1286 Transcript_714/m.1286 type:complete len:559 (+) Transcript_714:58-1734(+)